MAKEPNYELGLMPLEFILRTMRDTNEQIEERKDAAKLALPYSHSRLSPIAPQENQETERQKRYKEIFWDGDVWPFLKNLFSTTLESEVEALAPLAESAVAALITDISTLGTPAGFIAAAAQVGAEVVKQATAKSLQVAGQSVLTAINAALVNAQSAASAAKLA